MKIPPLLPAALALAMTLGCPAAQADVYTRVDESGAMQFSSVPAEGFALYFKDTLGTTAGTTAASAADTTTPPAQTRRDDEAPYASQVRAAARATNVDAALIHAVMSVESGNNPAARSRAGAVGLMQLMPGTARRYNVKNRLDPAQNIRGGASYLRDLSAMFNNNLQLVLAAYNAGEQAVVKYGHRIPPFRETAAYVPKVMAYYRKFGGAQAQAANAPAQSADWRARLPQARIRQSFTPNVSVSGVSGVSGVNGLSGDARAEPATAEP